METEPTTENRQRSAFELLRDSARNAHIAGDGLLVNLLCHTGLQSLAQLAKEKKLLLPFSEVTWMPIFALYWLVNPSERYTVEQTLKELELRTEDDRLVWQWVERYRILIGQPLAGDAQMSPVLNEFAWPGSFAEHSIEVEALVSHMVELAWFHGPSAERWKGLADTWVRTAPVWLHRVLADLKARLDLQARLTSPDEPLALIPETEASRLRAHYDLAELWLLHLHGRSAAVCEAAERLAPCLSAESHRWRVLHDFIHFDSFLVPREDSQNVHLARRRHLSVETPLLMFNDKRDECLTETLGQLFRARSKASASKRWDIFILARLHELAALRLWDYGMWLDAIRAQAQASLEVVQWSDEHPDLSVTGLILAVRSFSAKSPEEDSVVRRAIDRLEFAPPEALLMLSDALLATYLVQKYQALKLLDDITDLLPPSVWPALARWTDSYIQESADWRTRGSTLAPAKHWAAVLPVLPGESPVWAILQPQAKAMANCSICWRGEYKSFLQLWLLFAPLELARQASEAMLAHPETAPEECLSRTEILTLFEDWKPELRGLYTRRLLPTARSDSEAFILAEHLEEPDVKLREEALRERLSKSVREAIAQAMPEPNAPQQFPFPHVTGLHLVSHWRTNDRPLLEELIAAVNSPNVLAESLICLLQSLQLLVANGPAEFAELVQPHVTEWTRHLPCGRREQGVQCGPLSVFQWSGQGEEEIALMLGWLVFQLPRKLGVAAHPVVITWAQQMLLMGKSKPLEMAIYGTAVVALQTPSPSSTVPLALMETAILSLIVRSDDDQDAMQSLANALRMVSDLIDPSPLNRPENVGLPPSSDSFVAVLSRLIPRLAKSPRASLRAAVAKLIWELGQHGRQEDWLKELHTTLKRDHRARVRFEAQGGWKDARAASRRGQLLSVT